MLRLLFALAVAGLLVAGGSLLEVDGVAWAQSGQGPGLPPPKKPFCKDCWDQLDRYMNAWKALDALKEKQRAAGAKYDAFKAKFGPWGTTPEQGAEAAELRGEQLSFDKDIAVQQAALERALAELQRCNARKCFEDVSLTPVPPAWFQANEPCAACRPLAAQVAYLKFYVKSLRTTVAQVDKLEGLETDLRVKQRVRLSLQTTIDIHGKHKDDGTLAPVDQINLNDAVERLPEVEKKIRELEQKIKEAKAALDACVTGKCTEKPVAIDRSTPTGKTEQRRTEQSKTEPGKTGERKTEKKETGRTALKSRADGNAGVPSVSISIGVGGGHDRRHHHESHPRSGGDSGGRGNGGFGLGGGAMGFGR